MTINFNKLQVIDSPDVEQTGFDSNMKRWLANLVDVLNSNFLILNSVNEAFQNLITSGGVNAGGGWPAPFNVPVIGLTPSGFVTAILISSTLPTTISLVTPLTNSFNITFSNDPGVSAIVVYQAFITEPQ